MRIQVRRIWISAALSLGFVVASFITAGCSETASGNKTDDPALKAAMQKSTEIYKSKTQQVKKTNKSSFKRPG